MSTWLCFDWPALIDEWQSPMRERITSKIVFDENDQPVPELVDGDELPWEKQARVVVPNPDFPIFSGGATLRSTHGPCAS